MKQKQKKFAATLVILAMVVFAGIFGTTGINASAASNSLSASYRLMYVGQSYTPSVSGSYSSIKWSSSNSNLVSVSSSGKVTAVNVGQAYIYAAVDGHKLTLKVEIVSKAAYNAVNYAVKAVGSRYSQARRMSTGYYDCSSLVWRSYASAGVYIGSNTKWAPTAAELGSTLNKSYKIVAYSGVSSSELLPGDVIFSSYTRNGRYRNISHTAIYVGNGKIVEAANSRTGVVKRNYSTSRVVLIARPTVSVSSTLQQPQLISAKVSSSSVSNTQIQVKWKKVSGASGYYIYRKAKGGSFKKIATVSGSSKITYTDKTAYAGSYIYTVRAYSGSKISPYNSTGVTASTKIAAPASVQAAAATTGIQVTWSAVQYATGYQVYRKTGNGSYSLVGTVSGQSTVSYQDLSAKDGEKYTYTVKAFRKNSSSNTVTSAVSVASASVIYQDSVALASRPSVSTGSSASVETEITESGASKAAGGSN